MSHQEPGRNVVARVERDAEELAGVAHDGRTPRLTTRSSAGRQFGESSIRMATGASSACQTTPAAPGPERLFAERSARGWTRRRGGWPEVIR